MRRLFDYLERQSKPHLLVTACLAIVFLGLLDYLTGPDLSIFIVYLVPVFLGTWFIGKWAGVTMSVLSALAWSLANRASAPAIISFWNFSVQAGFFLIVAYILLQLKGSLGREQETSRTDVSSGAVNRRSFIELADREIVRMRRYHHPFTAAYMAIDNFKTLNDTLGHQAGDAVLRLIVKSIQDNTRATDIVARLGGYEFMLFFPETGYETAQLAVDKVRHRLIDVAKEHSLSVTFSFGMITFQEPPPSVYNMIKLADDIMEKGKNKGNKNTMHHEVFVRGVLISS